MPLRFQALTPLEFSTRTDQDHQEGHEMSFKPTDWDNYYRRGTLRKPTDTSEMYPSPTEPLAEAQPYAYIDDLCRLAGSVLAGVGLSVLV
jgi:hypothetical protein